MEGAAIGPVCSNPGHERSPPHGTRTLSFPRIEDAERAGADPPYDYPDYVGTRLRHPKQPLVIVPHTLSEATGPVYGEGRSASSTTT